MGHMKWTKLINKYRSQVPSYMSQKFEEMAESQEKMTKEFAEKVQQIAGYDNYEKKIALKKIGQWYEQQDDALFKNHKFSSCWFLGRLVNNEFKESTELKEQFQEH